MTNYDEEFYKKLKRMSTHEITEYRRSAKLLSDLIHIGGFILAMVMVFNFSMFSVLIITPVLLLLGYVGSGMKHVLNDIKAILEKR